MKLGSTLLTPFDTSTLPSIPVPKLPNERTCAWLNSTHLPRRSEMPAHPDELQGIRAPLSPPTWRAEQMERDSFLPITRNFVSFFDCTPEHPERAPWYYSRWPSAYPTSNQHLAERSWSQQRQERWVDVPGTARISG
jgi:hypothetical protein